MKRSGLLLLLFGLCTVVHGQNLVPNPGFEEYKTLPCEEGLYFMEALLKDWIQPIPTTPDYWNSLANADCLLNPDIVNDSARTGNGMIGIVTASFEAGFKSEYKEYLEVKLKSKLKKGGFYNVEFYTKSRIKDPNPVPSAKFEANNLGVAFSDSLIHIIEGANSPDHLSLKTAVKTQKVISSKWEKVGSCVTARSDAQYLLIGNFDSVDSTTLVQLTSDYTDYSYTYYFIDDVNVEELPYDVSRLAAISPLCFDQSSIDLNAFVEGATSYLWEAGSNGSTFNVDENVTKDYFVNISFNECTYRHKFHVEFLSEIDLGPDTVLCDGESMDLVVENSTFDIQWSDGSIDPVKHISAAGVYSISSQNPYCVVQDTIAVDFMDCPGFAPNIITPNDDIYNEYFVFENIKHGKWSLSVFNRWGERVYFSADYQNDWNGNGLPNGLYYYKLNSAALHSEVKGWVNVRR
ncbi:MAG TPA: gliding motility-associated C-terminal domain-containing protein [Chryseolinea sp.]|nr:gliding motility-associated C-terminal domain-containing protein [Chryseolinea sp.]